MRRHGEVKALDGHVRDSEQLIKRANTTDTLKKALPVSRQLQESRSVLEAEYAVLNEVSAKNAALQAKLRDAQPLLWMDNALVMHRSKKEERRAGSAWEALDPTDTGLLRHRRRLQWEVSRRIARVDRELSSNPPTQRFWHVRERKRREQQEEERRKQEQEREAERRKMEKARRLQRQQEEVARSKQAVKKAVERAKPEILREYEFVKNISEPVVTKETPKEIPLPDFSDEEDKENKPKTKAVLTRRRKAKPVHKAAETPVDSKVKQNPLDPTEDASVPGFLETEEARSYHNATNSPSDGFPLHVQPSAIDPLDVRVAPASPRELSFEPESPRPVPVLPNNAGSSRQHNPKSMSSSLGRQVLSDYRTMPSVASFGAPPVEAKRLNGDVLRRLFSDLDSDRDGHLNRLETCMALHRLHIDVPAPKIAAFFNRIHTTEATEPRRHVEPAVASAPPLKQVISFKQFVAFITAAFEQQQCRKQVPTPPQPVRTSHREHGQRPHPHPSPKLRIPPLTPRTSSPSRSQRSPVRIEKTHKSKESHDRDVPAPIVVMQENQEKTIEERVLERLPEYLLPQLLADDASRAEGMVRRSLERLALASDNGVDDAMVKTIAEQVMRAFVQQVMTGKSHQKVEHEVDVSGLRGAGLDWETEPIQVLPPLVMDVEEEAKTRDDWWNALSEEQITSLVREIYSQRQQKVLEVVTQPPDSEQVFEEEVVDDALLPTTEISVQADVAVAAPEEVGRQHIQLVAEKAIQTTSIEWSTPAPLPSPPEEEAEEPLPVAMAESTEAPPAIVEPFNEGEVLPPLPSLPASNFPVTQTLLGRLLLNSGSAPARRVTQTTTLQELRRARRRRQNTHLHTMLVSGSTVIEEPDVVSTHKGMAGSAHASSIDTRDGIDTHRVASVAASSEIDEIPMELQQTVKPVLTQEKKLDLPTTSAVDAAIMSELLSVGRRSSFSSSSLSLDSDHLSRNAFEARRRHGSRRLHSRKPRRSMMVSDSLDGDESGSENQDLSEGEIAQNDVDLSDGEVYGGLKRRILKRANVEMALAHEPQEEDDWLERSSVESGELPRMAFLQRDHHQRLLNVSTSSLESGELEDGAMPVPA